MATGEYYYRVSVEAIEDGVSRGMIATTTSKLTPFCSEKYVAAEMGSATGHVLKLFLRSSTKDYADKLCEEILAAMHPERTETDGD